MYGEDGTNLEFQSLLNSFVQLTTLQGRTEVWPIDIVTSDGSVREGGDSISIQ